MASEAHVLLVEDNPGDVELLLDELDYYRAVSFRVTVAGKLSEALAQLAGETSFDAVVLDLDLPDAIGLKGLSALIDSGCELPIVVQTGLGHNEELATKALRAGAQDYIGKTDYDRALLPRTLRYAIERHANQRRLLQARAETGQAAPREKRHETLSPSEHYLKRELYELVRTDHRIFEFLQEGSLDGIWYWDLEAREHEWMSPRFWESFGYSAHEKEHLASEWQDMMHPSDLQVALRNFKIHCEDERHPYDQIVRYTHKDGSTVWVRCRGIVVRDEDGQPKRMLGAHTDITALKEAEDALLRQSKELRRSNEELEQFAYIASHDLREPLRMVSSFAQLLARRYPEQLDDKGVGYIGRIVDGTRRMQQMVDELLEISRVSTSQSDYRQVDLAQVIRRAVDVLGEAIAQSSATVEIAEGSPIVYGSQHQLERVFVNLLGNAIKFRGEAPPHIRVEMDRVDDRWNIRVRDNGLGFSAENASRIFRMFKRLHGQSEYEGVGMGLAIVKKIVECHGGSVSATGSVDQGATFTISLPEGSHDEQAAH